jgi:hypothetical protein
MTLITEIILFGIYINRGGNIFKLGEFPWKTK